MGVRMLGPQHTCGPQMTTVGVSALLPPSRGFQGWKSPHFISERLLLAEPSRQPLKHQLCVSHESKLSSKHEHDFVFLSKLSFTNTSKKPNQNNVRYTSCNETKIAKPPAA